MTALAKDPEENSLRSPYWVGEIDLRPVALFRIALGAFVLFDLFEFTPNLRAWFSDEGVFPRAAFLSSWARGPRLCLLDAFGAPPMVWVYWGLAVLAATAMMIGYRSRWAAALSFILVAGFQERLPPLFDGSDSVLRLMLFWHLFTRSGNVWSIDALQAASAGRPLSAKGPALPVRILQSQIGWVYFCSVFFKEQGSFWRDGTAVHYVMHLTGVFTHPWAAPIGDSKALVMIGTYGTLALEATFLFLIHSPLWHRQLKALALIGGTMLHGAIGLTMAIGHFSYMMPMMYLPMFERDWTQSVVSFIHRRLPKGWDAFWASLADRLPQGSPPRVWAPHYQKLAMAAVAFAFVCVSWYSLPAQAKRFMPGPLVTGVEYASLWSSWDMFAPEPLHTDYRLTAQGELEDGRPINVFGDLFRRAKGESGEFRGHFFTRWWKYEENVIGGNQTLPLEWGRFICREHNYHLKPGEPRLHTFSLTKESVDIPKFDQPWPEPRREVVWNHQCYETPEKRPTPSAPIATELPSH
jgi:hypothetical protein